MKPRAPDLLRLDVASFAAEAGHLAGEWRAEDLPRLHESQTPPQDVVPAPVRWQVDGEVKAVAGAAPQLWLKLQADTTAWLTCQRCLQPMLQPLALDTAIRFVRGESQAEALDAEVEYDVLALPRGLDVRALVEDELLLALPIVPRHDSCPQPLVPAADASGQPGQADDAAEPAPERENPFAVLAALRRTGH
jgi:uncharacterized protein